MLRIKFEKFLNYLQGSLNFSQFIRSEISKFGVGQAAVDMAFQTAMRFPDIFVLEKIRGEEPLYVYTLDISDVLTQSELSAGLIQKDYQFEGDELKNKFINYNISSDVINAVFADLDSKARNSKMLDFVSLLRSNGVSAQDIVSFMKSLSIEDMLISRIMQSTGGMNG